MAKLLVKKDRLKAAGFSDPKQANSFLPTDKDPYHIHLGVPTQLRGDFAPDGEVFVAFVAIKNPSVDGGQNLRQIQVSDKAGKYDLDTGNINWGKREDEFKSALRKAGIGVDK